MQELELDSIGTHLRLHIDTELSLDELFRSISLRLEKFENKFSRFIQGNWLDTVNIERKWTLDRDGYDMLSFALKVAQETNGYFDPTIAWALSTLGYGRREHKGHSVGYQHVILEGINVMLEWDVILEFGWVGKGYLIDILRSMIEEYFKRLWKNPPRFLINFWGDLYAHGEDWKIWLENPFHLEEAIGTIVLKERFLACSSGTKRKWGSHHHLIDPKTGASAHEVLATFIEGSSGLVVDTYSTALSVMPFDRACEFLFDHEAIDWILLSSDGKVFRSPGSKSELFTA